MKTMEDYKSFLAEVRKETAIEALTPDDGGLVSVNVDGKYNLSAVVTHHTSDWSVITLDRPVPYIWIKAVRRLDAVEIFYSFDDKEYTMMRNCWLQDNTPVMVGLMAACPDGQGFEARFENFTIKHLPDQRRVQWLEQHQ